MQERSALIHQQIWRELDCYNKQASQPRMPIFSSILVVLKESVFQYLHFHIEEFAANGRSAQVARCFLAYASLPPGATGSLFLSFCELNRPAIAYPDQAIGQTEG